VSVEPLLSKWEVRRLEELSSAIQYGYTAKATTERLGPKLLRITDIQNDAVDWDAVPFCEISPKEIEKYRLGKNDLLFARTGATVGKSYLIPGSIPDSVFASYLIRVRLLEDVIPKYVAYFFRSLDYWRQITETQAGIGQPNVNGTKLAQIKIPVAPLSQQGLIVAEIEKQFSRLDEAVANLRSVKANLKRYKASVLKAAVEGKLTEDWRKLHPNVEPASKLLERILAERRPKFGRKKDSFLTAEGDLPAEVPDGWAICSINQIAECLDSKRVPVNKTERAKRGGNVPYYGANGQVGVIDDYIFDEPLVLVVEDETFTGRTQAFSYLIRGKSWVNNHAHVLRTTAAVTVGYLNYGLAHYPFIPRTTGSTGRRKLTQKGLMTAPFLLPPLVEQEQIVAEVERRLSIIEGLEAALEANLTRAARLRQSILATAFAGKLVKINPAKMMRGVLTPK
jgi:type I restriction enzyme, S subunit